MAVALSIAEQEMAAMRLLHGSHVRVFLAKLTMQLSRPVKGQKYKRIGWKAEFLSLQQPSALAWV